jgi:hypothetical protein
MTVVIVVCVATAVLIGWLMVLLARAATEIRVPRALALGRLGPSAYRAIRAAPARLHPRPEPREPSAEPQSRGHSELDPEDVELAVRERLYGTPGSR